MYIVHITPILKTIDNVEYTFVNVLGGDEEGASYSF
jgi:hypothetical protein